MNIERGEIIGGGTGPVINLKHGPSSGTQRTHQIYSYTGDLRIAADSNETMQFFSGSNERMRMWSGGTLSVPTGIELGNGFNGATSNTLDDYEEGNWTPLGFNNASGSSTNSTSSRYAYYVKVGRLVHISAFINIAKGSVGNTTALEIYGLPFTATGTNSLHGSISVGYYDGSNAAVSYLYATAQPGSNHLLLRYTGGSGGVQVFNGNASLVSSSFNIVFGGTYVATT